MADLDPQSEPTRGVRRIELDRFGRDVRAESQTMARGFAQFLLRGNVVDLAVAVAIGAAAGGVITSFVRDIFSPLFGALFGGRSRKTADAYFMLNHSKVMYGDFFNVLLTFLIIAVVVYFFVITPVNKLVTSSHFAPPPDPSTRKCPECLSEIPKAARRCAYCTSPVSASE
ncbi:MAG: large conductance mechanosensitive channel protein MscL [Candidatus Eremiobacteraeota bacterium]|nr:large conductance mechanosensitive channel protein MscL [Candidatus Eremiobacteraeota bacterium]